MRLGMLRLRDLTGGGKAMLRPPKMKHRLADQAEQGASPGALTESVSADVDQMCGVPVRMVSGKRGTPSRTDDPKCY